MGLTRVTVRVQPIYAKPTRSRRRAARFLEAEFLVDTGAMHCLVPASALRRIGVAVEGAEVYELANGETVEYDVGFALVEFMGSRTVTKVIFGPEKGEPILGVVALESTGIEVNPVTQTLKRMPAIPLKRVTYGTLEG